MHLCPPACSVRSSICVQGPHTHLPCVRLPASCRCGVGAWNSISGIPNKAGQDRDPSRPWAVPCMHVPSRPVACPCDARLSKAQAHPRRGSSSLGRGADVHRAGKVCPWLPGPKGQWVTQTKLWPHGVTQGALEAERTGASSPDFSLQLDSRRKGLDQGRWRGGTWSALENPGAGRGAAAGAGRRARKGAPGHSRAPGLPPEDGRGLKGF